MYHETRWAQEASAHWQRVIPAPDGGEYSSIKSYFKTGTKDEKFDTELGKLIKDVYNYYSDGDDAWAKRNPLSSVNKKTVFKYLETLTVQKGKAGHGGGCSCGQCGEFGMNQQDKKDAKQAGKNLESVGGGLQKEKK